MNEPVQSVLHPASEAAARIEWLWWVFFATCGSVFLIVLVLLAIAVWGQPRGPATPPLGSTRFVVVSGIILPAIILVGLFFASLHTNRAVGRMPETALTIQVVGHQFWWHVHYPAQKITLANQIWIPAGQPVRLELTSADVIHSFWVPRLHGKMDLNPGQTTAFWIAADRPGEYRGQCAEYCGVQHANMAFWVVALPPEQFDAWIAARTAPPAEPATALLRHGREVFFRTGCGQCHTIRGTAAQGKIGPELSHVGSNLTIGAGTRPNTRGDLQGWIVNSQAIKPGNKMPRMFVPSADLHALAAYLESLK